MTKTSDFLRIAALGLCIAAGTTQMTKAQFSGGTGVLGDPYVITTEAQLKTLANSVNAGIAQYRNAYYLLGNDLDFSNFAYADTTGWIPIGNSTSGQEFQGNFNGNGKVIKNLMCNEVKLTERKENHKKHRSDKNN